MVKVMRVTRGIGIVLGGFVTLVGFMSIVGLITDNFWVRLLGALVIVVGLPAFLTDRLLKKMKGGGLGFVADIFAIVLLAFALILVAADFMSKPLFVREGDRYARSGSKTMARLAYYLGGVSPTFPEPGAAGSASASASASASGSAAPKASK
jgi:serine protease Do